MEGKQINTRLFCYLGHVWLRRIWFPLSLFRQKCRESTAQERGWRMRRRNKYTQLTSQLHWITKKRWSGVCLGNESTTFIQNLTGRHPISLFVFNAVVGKAKKSRTCDWFGWRQEAVVRPLRGRWCISERCCHGHAQTKHSNVGSVFVRF